MAKIILINPKFEASYWGFEYAMPLIGRKANLPVACLPLLAALTPAEHSIELIDENVADLDFDHLARADIVGVTGMSVQRHRMREILKELKNREVFTVVGGPWVTVKEDYFGALADVIFVGEAEETWPAFLSEWTEGRPAVRYEQSAKTDMTRVPSPRYDLIDARRYVFGSLQISRGCPFQCEFCDIIVTFGRRPRLKHAHQVLSELDDMRRAGFEIVFIADDNLIGNKQAIKPILREIVQWQQRNGYPLSFFSEASIDLADDDELMDLFVQANIQAVFIGVETPNLESLKETKKFQNLRSGGSIVEKLHRIQRNGMEVWSGMILGFDNDDPSIFDAQLEFAKQAKIAHAMCGMLTAIPKTPLYDRLITEHRLDFDDQPEFGTNVIPKRMSREELRDGYRRTMRDLNDVDLFFDRVDSLFLDPSFVFNRAQRTYWKSHPIKKLAEQTWTLIKCGVLYRRLMKQVGDRELKKKYRQRVSRVWKVRREPAALLIYLLKCAIHFHYLKIAERIQRTDTPLVNVF